MRGTVLFSLFAAVSATAPVLWGDIEIDNCSVGNIECKWYPTDSDAWRAQSHTSSKKYLKLMTGQKEKTWQCSFTRNSSATCAGPVGDPFTHDTTVHVFKESNIAFRCPSSNSSCTWHRENNDTVTSKKKHPRYKFLNVTKFNCSMEISNVQMNDSGLWQCNNTIKLIVHDKAVKDNSLKTVDGAAVTLPCRSPRFNVSNRDAYVQTSGRSHHSSFDRVRDSFDKLCFWIHDDTTTVFSHRPSATPEYQIISGAGPALQCDLLIHRVRKEQQGDWYCTRGRDPRQKVQLKVADRVGGREPDVTAVEGYTAFLPCNVITTNDLCFWTHGTHVVFSENQRNTPGYDIVSNPEKGNCNLLIRKAQEGDSGSWYCHVFGNGPIRMELEVKKLT